MTPLERRRRQFSDRLGDAACYFAMTVNQTDSEPSIDNATRALENAAMAFALVAFEFERGGRKPHHCNECGRRIFVAHDHAPTCSRWRCSECAGGVAHLEGCSQYLPAGFEGPDRIRGSRALATVRRRASVAACSECQRLALAPDEHADSCSHYMNRWPCWYCGGDTHHRDNCARRRWRPVSRREIDANPESLCSSSLRCRDCGYIIAYPCGETLPDDHDWAGHRCTLNNDHEDEHGFDCPVCETRADEPWAELPGDDKGVMWVNHDGSSEWVSGAELGAKLGASVEHADTAVRGSFVDAAADVIGELDDDDTRQPLELVIELIASTGELLASIGHEISAARDRADWQDVEAAVSRCDGAGGLLAQAAIRITAKLSTAPDAQKRSDES